VKGPRTAELEIPAESRYVAAAREFVADEARAAGWLDDEQVDDLRLVVSETVTNALRAHVTRDVEELIRVRSSVFDDRVEISVTDAAGGFEVSPDPVALVEPDLAREGGFGLPLIEALSDEAHFTPTDAGTVVRVVVYRAHR
jgi:serine/threonine-protein kinase RsbW